MVEKVGAPWHLDDHQVKADAERFKQFIEDRGTETGQYRGDHAAPGTQPHDQTAAAPVSSTGTETPPLGEQDPRAL